MFSPSISSFQAKEKKRKTKKKTIKKKKNV
jgi:hypothetical protein